ncbi:cyclin-dependent kinase-like 3 [Seriola dumerili]|uniref:cyclin-dependent kinase-like 3 n=1 Tax=Seriola dumerili TaxID=41447 RepID=UPI000BBE1662|nr:cyclin-dependent kinase-like 3 [Seriola dumerili]
MERYESLGLVGEGSYGTVLKCRHRDSGRLVAIKKFMDSDDDKMVKKIAQREIKLLRQLRHGNLVNLLEVWKRRRRWYLVFEFVERTLLDDLEQNPSGLNLNTSRQYLYQILRAAAFCHQQNIIHRDIKPENILISQEGVVKLCDFGFARTMASPADGGVYTDYVATRWYRAPELLVGDIKYGKPVDVWAVGCLLLEMLTGQPLFPGDSDLDQIYHIVRCFGNLTAHHQELFYRNPVFSGVRLPECYGQVPLQQRFPTITSTAIDLAQSCLQMDPERRAQCSELLEHPLFTQDSFHIRFLNELNAKIQKDIRENSIFPKITKTPRREKDDGNERNQRGKEKKQLEDLDEKVNKEKEKKDEKTEKTKGKQPSKLSKTIRNTSEPLMSTKQSKTLGAKLCKITTTSEHQARDPEQRQVSECSKVLTSNSKLSKATSNSDSEITKTNMSLSIVPSKTRISDLSTQSFKVFIDTSPAHSTTTLPKGVSNPKLSKTVLTSIAKPTNDITCLSNKPSKGFQKDRELTEVSVKTKTQQDSFNTSYEVIKEDHGNLKLRPATKAAGKHIPVSHASGKDHKEDPESSEPSGVHQQTTLKSKISPESRSTSASILSEIPKTNTLKVSDKENREDLALSVSTTTLIPTFSVVNANSPATSDHHTLGAGFHPGSHSLRCIDKPRHHGGVYSRLAQQSLSSHITASITAQVSDKSLISKRSFLSDRCNLGNSGGVAVAKRKSDIHFPDLRSSVLPELRGRDGMHKNTNTHLSFHF